MAEQKPVNNTGKQVQVPDDVDVNEALVEQRNAGKAHVSPELADSLNDKQDGAEQDWPRKVQTTMNDDVHEVDFAEYETLKSQGLLREEYL